MGALQVHAFDRLATQSEGAYTSRLFLASLICSLFISFFFLSCRPKPTRDILGSCKHQQKKNENLILCFMKNDPALHVYNLRCANADIGYHNVSVYFSHVRNRNCKVFRDKQTKIDF